MAELSALNVRLNGDASGLKAALNTAEMGLKGVASEAARAETALVAAGNQAKVAGSQMKMAAGHTTNLMFQFQDIGMMLAAGQSPLMLAMQQGTQVSGIFQQMGGTARSVFPAIKAALVSMVSPMSLLTIGAIAGGAALVQWGMSALGASEDTKTFEDALGDLKDITEGLKSAQSILLMSTDELTERYGRYAEAVRAAAQELLQIRVIEADRALRDQFDALGDVVDGYTAATDRVREMRGALTRIQNDFAMTEDQAMAFHGALLQLEAAGSFDEQQAALAEVRAQLEAAGISLEEIPDSLRDAIARMNELQIAAAAAANEMERGAAASMGMSTGVPLFAQGFSGAGLLPPNAPPSGGRTGGRSRTDPLPGQLETLRESLMTEEELELASFEKRQETLQQALERQLLTRQEYAALTEQLQEQHAQRLAEIDVWRHGTALDKTESFLGSMSDALRGGNEEMLRISKAFGAAQALVSAWQGAAEALKLPFPENLAAFAQVLGQGLSAVSAIQSVNANGGGATAAAAAAPVAASAPARTMSIDIRGDGVTSSIASALKQQLGPMLNEAYENGWKPVFV